MNVWREGDRIRRDNGSGWGDMVPDGEIHKHLASAASRMQLDSDTVAFAAAVLALRAQERRFAPRGTHE